MTQLHFSSELFVWSNHLGLSPSHTHLNGTVFNLKGGPLLLVEEMFAELMTENDYVLVMNSLAGSTLEKETPDIERHNVLDEMTSEVSLCLTCLIEPLVYILSLFGCIYSFY